MNHDEIHHDYTLKKLTNPFVRTVQMSTMIHTPVVNMMSWFKPFAGCRNATILSSSTAAVVQHGVASARICRMFSPAQARAPLILKGSSSKKLHYNLQKPPFRCVSSWPSASRIRLTHQSHGDSSASVTIPLGSAGFLTSPKQVCALFLIYMSVTVAHSPNRIYSSVTHQHAWWCWLEDVLANPPFWYIKWMEKNSNIPNMPDLKKSRTVLDYFGQNFPS